MFNALFVFISVCAAGIPLTMNAMLILNAIHSKHTEEENTGKINFQLSLSTKNKENNYV